jgi:hypothetical protein
MYDLQSYKHNKNFSKAKILPILDEKAQPRPPNASPKLILVHENKGFHSILIIYYSLRSKI